MKPDIIRKIILMLLPLTLSSVAIAQNDDFQKIFDDFQKANERDFQSFQAKANAEYSEFLRQAWIEVHGHKPIAKPKVEPIIPSEVHPNEVKVEDKAIQCDVNVIDPEEVRAPAPIEPINEVALPFFRQVSFSKYGTKCTVRYNKDKKPVLSGVDEMSIADFWDALSSSPDVKNLLYDFLEFRRKRSLSDWAYYKFVEAFASQIYPDAKNSATLMHAYILTQTGFKLRLGYDKSKTLHMIVASDRTVYDCLFWELGKSKYYLFDGANISSLSLSKVDFSSSKPMRLLSDSENLLDNMLTEGRRLSSKLNNGVAAEVSVNQNLLSFYNDYPASASVGESPVSQWLLYANTPLSQIVRESLYPQLSSIISSKSELDAANILLNFVQTAFAYKSDDDVWGKDRSFFAEECLYYPFSDCEDRSILFSHMIRDLLGLDIALIYSPGHLFVAVCFNENVKGSYVTVGGRKFVICDPTVTNGAPVGFCAVDDNAEDFKVGLVKKLSYGKDYKVNLVSSDRFVKSLFPVKMNGKWGYKNTKGEVVVPCEYDSVSDYEQGDRALYAAKKDDILTLYYENGQKAGTYKGYIPLDVQCIEVGGTMMRADYMSIVKADDGHWYYYDILQVADPHHLCFDDYEMENVTYEKNIYSSSKERYFRHYIILKHKQSQKYGVLNLGWAADDYTTSSDITKVSPKGVVVPFEYDQIKFVDGDKSKVVLYQQGRERSVQSLE